MKFPNAYKGIKKIHLAELLMILCTVLAIASLFVLAWNNVDLQNVTEEALAESSISKGAAGTAAGLSLASGLLIIVAFILELVGVINGMKDDDNFKSALAAIGIGIVLNVLKSVLKSDFLDDWANTGNNIFSYLATWYILTAIVNLAEKLFNNDVKELAKKTRIIVSCTYILSAIANAVAAFIGKSTTVVTVIGVVALVAEIVSYLLFLRALSQGKKMLAQ